MKIRFIGLNDINKVSKRKLIAKNQKMKECKEIILKPIADGKALIPFGVDKNRQLLVNYKIHSKSKRNKYI